MRCWCLVGIVLPMLMASGRLRAQTKTLQQLESDHVDLRFGMFIHFNMNTFFPGWGEPRTDPRTFNPTALDTTQWAAAAKSAGVRYALLTTKHHDGFAIWPSRQTPPNGMAPYTILQSAVPSRDVVREYVDAFRAQGILPGLYFSMWDVANVGGTYANPGYTDTGAISWSRVKDFVLGQITELLGGTYGEIPIFIIDGYSWSMGHRQVPYQEIRALIKRLQPNCLIIDHNGAVPWEVDVMYFEEPLGIQAPAGNTFPGCQGQTISGDWFWDATAANPATLKTTQDIVDHLTRLQPLYTNFILNCPPNRQGLFDQAVVDRLAAVGRAWTVNTARAPLPVQEPAIEYPVTPVAATASSGNPSLAIDGLNDFTNGPRHQTLWQSAGALPQSVTLDLGRAYGNLDILKYLPNRDNVAGAITSYRISVSADGSAFTPAVSGAWLADSRIKTAEFPAQTARYVRLEALAVSGGAAAVIGEVAVGASRAPLTIPGTGSAGGGTGGSGSIGSGGGAGTTVPSSGGASVVASGGTSGALGGGGGPGQTNSGGRPATEGSGGIASQGSGGNGGAGPNPGATGRTSPSGCSCHVVNDFGGELESFVLSAFVAMQALRLRRRTRR